MNDELKQAIADELNVDPGELTSDKNLPDLEDFELGVAADADDDHRQVRRERHLA